MRLTPKTEGLLLAFLESSGRLLTKTELLERLWSATFVEPGTLTFQIHQLRQALGDTAAAPTYIATVAGRGYRFVCPVVWEPAKPVVSPAPQVVPLSVNQLVTSDTATNQPAALRELPRRTVRRMIAVAGFVLLAPITVAIAIDSREPPLPAVTSITPLTQDGKTKTDLVMLDPSRLSFAIAGKRYELRLADNRVAARPDLDEYRILDASPVRGELLANRPHDRGAEQGLWAVRTDGSNWRRIGMVKTLGPAAWSHDGKHIAYAFENTLYVTDSDGGGRRTVAGFTASPVGIRWSPDDETLWISGLSST